MMSIEDKPMDLPHPTPASRKPIPVPTPLHAQGPRYTLILSHPYPQSQKLLAGEIFMDPITTQQQLMETLTITSLDEPISPDALTRFCGLANNVTPELFTELLRAAPKIAKAFTDYLASLNEYGASIETSKQQRWQCLTAAVSTGQMTGEQILEAMSLLAESDAREADNFERHGRGSDDLSKRALKTVQLVVGVVVFFILATAGATAAVMTKER